ncbi:MAG: serine protease Do, partial [Candidatus Hydrogenedentes bacterium]|nr:serine protease Do [Candidatus Hydrogenedentota bacterium]
MVWEQSVQSVSRRIRAVTGFAVLLAAFGAWALDTESIVQSNEAAAVVVWGTRAGSDTVLQGSGCCVARSGYILTVAHQVVGVTGLRARLEDGSERTLDPVAIDEPGDLALLKASEKLPLAARIGDAEELKSGSNLVSIAAPMGLEFSAATGMVSNPNRTLRGRWVIQADIAASPGSSGGPVFDRNGLLVGLIVNRLDREEWVKVIIPINNAYGMLRAQGIPVPVDKASADELQIIPASGLTSAEVSAVQAYNAGVGAIEAGTKADHYLRAVQLLPQFFEAWFNLAVAYTTSNKRPEALKAYLKAESLRPGVLAVQRNLGRLHIEENRLDLAVV